MSKQYGLILSKKSKDYPILPVSKSHSIFNEDSDSDAHEASKPTGSQAIKKQDKLNQKKAIQEDPTVYQYDEVYDAMEQQKRETKLAKKDTEKKPKYINRLLAAAEKRKRENERRIERQVQKEREEEGDKFKDKESFVTSAYKKKLEEMKKLEEEEKREEYLESIGDVRKQGNLDGFYRYLYDQKVNYEEKREAEVKQEVKEEPKSDNEITKKENDESMRLQSPQSSPEIKTQSKSSELEISEERSSCKRKQQSSEPSTKKSKVRNYRTRQDSHEDSDQNEDREIKKEHLPSNIDADSDFSIDSSDSEDESISKENQKETKLKQNESPTENACSEDKIVDKDKKDLKNDIVKEEVKKEDSPKIKKPKIDIWKKRTVGEKFDQAVKRYFERKAQREMGL